MNSLDINFLEDKVGEDKIWFGKRLQVMALNFFARLNNPEQLLSDLKKISKPKIENVKSKWELANALQSDKVKALSLLKGKTEENIEVAKDILTKLETINLNEPQVYNSDYSDSIDKAIRSLQTKIEILENDNSTKQHGYIEHLRHTLAGLENNINPVPSTPPPPNYLTHLDRLSTLLKNQIQDLEVKKTTLDDKPNNWGKVNIFRGSYVLNESYKPLEDIILDEKQVEPQLREIKKVVVYELRGISSGFRGESPEARVKREQKALELKTLEKQIDVLILDIQKSVAQKEIFLASLPKVQEAKSLDKLTEEVGKFYLALDNRDGDTVKKNIKEAWLACIYYLQQIDNLDLKGDNKKEFESLYKILIEGEGVFKGVTITKETTVDDRINILQTAISLLNPDETDLNKSDAALLKTNIASLSAQIKTFENINQELIKLKDEKVATYDTSIEESESEISLLEEGVATIDNEIIQINKEITETNAQKDNQDPEEINKKRAELTEKKRLQKERLGLLTPLQSRQNQLTEKKSAITSSFTNITAITQPYLTGYIRQEVEATKVFEEVKKAYKYASDHSVDILKDTLEDRKKREVAEQKKDIKYNNLEHSGHFVKLGLTSLGKPNLANTYRAYEANRLDTLKRRLQKERKPMSFLSDEILRERFGSIYLSLRGDGRLEGILNSNLMDYNLDDPELYNQIVAIDLNGITYFIPAAILAVLNLLKPLKVDELITGTGEDKELKLIPGVPVKVMVDFSGSNLTSNSFDRYSLDDLDIVTEQRKALLGRMLFAYGNLRNNTPKSNGDRDSMGASLNQCLKLATDLGIDVGGDIRKAMEAQRFVWFDEKTGKTEYNEVLLTLYNGDKKTLELSQILSNPVVNGAIVATNVASLFLPFNVYGVSPTTLLSSALGTKWVSSKTTHWLRTNPKQPLLNDPTHIYVPTKDIKPSGERIAAGIVSMVGAGFVSAKTREITNNNFAGNVAPVAVALLTSWAVSLLAKKIREEFSLRSILSAKDLKSAITVLLANNSKNTEVIKDLTNILRPQDITNLTPVEKQNLNYILSDTYNIEQSLIRQIRSIRDSLFASVKRIDSNTQSTLISNVVDGSSATVSDILAIPITIDLVEPVERKVGDDIENQDEDKLSNLKYRVDDEVVDAINLIFPQENSVSLQSNFREATNTQIRSQFYDATSAFRESFEKRSIELTQLRGDYNKNEESRSQITQAQANITSRLNVSGQVYQDLGHIDSASKLYDLELDRLNKYLSHINNLILTVSDSPVDREEILRAQTSLNDHIKQMGKTTNLIGFLSSKATIDKLSDKEKDALTKLFKGIRLETQDDMDNLITRLNGDKIKFERTIETLQIKLYSLNKDVANLTKYQDSLQDKIRVLDRNNTELKQRSTELVKLNSELGILVASAKQEDSRIRSLLKEVVGSLQTPIDTYKEHLLYLVQEMTPEVGLEQFSDLTELKRNDAIYTSLPDKIKPIVSTIISLNAITYKDATSISLTDFVTLFNTLDSNISNLKNYIKELNRHELNISLGDLIDSMIQSKAELPKISDPAKKLEAVANWDKVKDDILLGIFGYLYLLHKQFDSKTINVIKDFAEDRDFKEYLKTGVIADGFRPLKEEFERAVGIKVRILGGGEFDGKTSQEISRQLEKDLYESIRNNTRLNDVQKDMLIQTIQLNSTQPFPKSGKLLAQEAKKVSKNPPSPTPRSKNGGVDENGEQNDNRPSESVKNKAGSKLREMIRPRNLKRRLAFSVITFVACIGSSFFILDGKNIKNTVNRLTPIATGVLLTNIVQIANKLSAKKEK